MIPSQNSMISYRSPNYYLESERKYMEEIEKQRHKCEHVQLFGGNLQVVNHKHGSALIPPDYRNKQREEEKRKQEEIENDPKYDDFFNRQDEMKKYHNSEEAKRRLAEVKAMTPAQKKRYLRTIAKDSENLHNEKLAEIKAQQEEEDRIARESDPWHIATRAVTGALSKAIGSVTPFGDIAETALNKLQDKLEGGKIRKKYPRKK